MAALQYPLERWFVQHRAVWQAKDLVERRHGQLGGLGSQVEGAGNDVSLLVGDVEALCLDVHQGLELGPPEERLGW